MSSVSETLCDVYTIWQESRYVGALDNHLSLTYLSYTLFFSSYFISRAYSLIWEVKQVERNARLFNEEESQIVRNSSRLVTVLNAFIR